MAVAEDLGRLEELLSARLGQRALLLRLAALDLAAEASPYRRLLDECDTAISGLNEAINAPRNHFARR